MSSYYYDYENDVVEYLEDYFDDYEQAEELMYFTDTLEYWEALDIVLKENYYARQGK